MNKWIEWIVFLIVSAMIACIIMICVMTVAKGQNEPYPIVFNNEEYAEVASTIDYGMPYSFVLYDVVTIYADGNVEVDTLYELSEAATMFWFYVDSVGTNMHATVLMQDETIKTHEATINRYRWFMGALLLSILFAGMIFIVFHVERDKFERRMK